MNQLKFKDVEMRLCFSLAFYLCKIFCHSLFETTKDNIRHLDSELKLVIMSKHSSAQFVTTVLRMLQTQRSHVSNLQNRTTP